MSVEPYKIVGHRLCPYVQRVVIVMREKGIAFERTDIDLDNKPAWLDDISPGRQVPVFRIGPDDWLFESSVIACYLDRVSGGGLMPGDPLARARHEAWMGYADDLLTIIARIIYRDADASALSTSMTELAERLKIIDERFRPRQYFAGEAFGLVDAVFATLFRYFPVLEAASDAKLETGLPGALADWWTVVRRRASVTDAVPRTYEAELIQFIAAKKSYAGHVLAQRYVRR
ncbi:glutathione S-transferase family protein [Phyllobacterium phragmitis]|uniref:Glutathione S-transferase family protein n=1 Tax=Phyllobacterium phragmitis TaxID=2670329 RepID=A0A2S9IJE5_9HYPH|nr:glutathione S-transferase family protein [Phyllobacterium phragmitis]PRD40663.1 glutathione S-transferase family protein [Phyllobacterium phragmitis]